MHQNWIGYDVDRVDPNQASCVETMTETPQYHHCICHDLRVAVQNNNKHSKGRHSGCYVNVQIAECGQKENGETGETRTGSTTVENRFCGKLTSNSPYCS